MDDVERFTMELLVNASGAVKVGQPNPDQVAVVLVEAASMWIKRHQGPVTAAEAFERAAASLRAAALN